MEVWTRIEGHPDYAVSNLGRVMRVAPDKYGRVGRILKPAVNKRTGYLLVSLWQDGKGYSKDLHVLVARHHVLNPSSAFVEVNHMDGVKSHCDAGNLQWRTKRGNIRHAVQAGLTGKGVWFDERRGQWFAHFSPEPMQREILGSFNTEHEALAVRQAAVQSLPVVH